MRRFPLAGFASAMALSVAASLPSVASAQDLGRLLERAARDSLRQALDPQRPERNAFPSNPGSRPNPYPFPNPNPTRATDPGRTPASPRKVETHAIKTADGWTLVALRYRPTASPRPGAATMPVILCHGLTYNARFWDLDPSCSFAEYLAAQGFDVWVVNLRGCGLSQKWVWSLEDAPEAFIGGLIRRSTHGKYGSTGYASIDPKYANWSMDDHVAYDVPALVSLVRGKTGAPEVAWVGHSMGGIVALAHLCRFQNPGIGRLVAIGSQFTMPEGQIPAQFLRELLTTRERQVSGVARGPELIAQSKTSVQNLFFNSRNVMPEVYQALTTDATDVPSIGLMRQYLSMAENGALLDARRQFNYASGLRNVTVPLFLGCGASDRFAPPVVLKFLFDRVGSADMTMLVFGRAGGFAAEAGHNDALIGLNSRAQVYPVLARWLAAPH